MAGDTGTAIAGREAGQGTTGWHAHCPCGKDTIGRTICCVCGCVLIDLSSVVSRQNEAGDDKEG